MSYGLLLLRVVVGGTMFGHGAQKLFGWFGGHGPAGTGGWLEAMGFRPGKPWALAAGATEMGGGLVTALGALEPLGPLATLAPMGVAIGKAHAGKPIWVTSGGAELPVTNVAIALALVLLGPGRFSLDRLVRVRLSALLVGLATGATAAALGLAL